jgi:hypothetical protein
MLRFLAPLAVGILLVSGCEPADDTGAGGGSHTPESVSTCLEEAQVPVRPAAPPSFNAVAELAVGELDGISVRVLFYEDEGGASGASNTIRIAGDPVARVGTVLVIPAGPGFEEAEDSVFRCLGVEPG